MNELMDILLIAATLGAGLVAGIFYAFSTFVMRALGQLREDQGIAAMKAINITVLNPFDKANHGSLLLAVLVVAVALLGKLVSGFAAWGKGIRRGMIGAAMAPRGEVVLVFAEVGREAGILDQSGFAVLVITVFVTAIFCPTLIGWLASRRRATGEPEPETDAAAP